ncbi:DUF1772-domain-containing protein [Penicillium malachiteum]|uniref:DUF1772-domain-containing protein n=1 Tax=Penicillium malachiteum TaxID=1324776 RepID=UPI002547793D|nr:DUF1772-domain-containing protein [Penicillium malachiteum]KAJ5725765.1 DUF1772-domain-containing protein [Penicillium malachiteum]
MDPNVGFYWAQAIGISGAAWLSGNIASLSTITTPTLLQYDKETNQSPRLLAQQWKSLFETGKAQNPPIAATVAASFLYLAWSVGQGAALYKNVVYNRVALYLAAAALTVGIVPFTIITMSGTNKLLLQKAQSTSESDREVPGLVKQWTGLNFARSLLPLAGAACGIIAAIS